MDSPNEKKAWTQDTIQQLINEQVEESLILDYKAADALGKSDNKKAEITKDVSAMANSAGGTIIYGVREHKERGKRHFPEVIDPVDRAQYSKEWLDQVIRTIEPRIDTVIVHPVSLENQPSGVVYVVEIPKSATAHQARDRKYYRRYNFASVPMHDYEVRDVMNRATLPDAQVEFLCELLDWSDKGERLMLKPVVHNRGSRLIRYFKLEFMFPDLGAVSPRVGLDIEPLGEVVTPIDVKDHTIASVSKERDWWRVKYWSGRPLFPEDKTGTEDGFLLKFHLKQDVLYEEVYLHWRLWADDMPLRQGKEALGGLPTYRKSIQIR